MTAILTLANLKVHKQQLVSPGTSNPIPLKMVAFETEDTVDRGDRIDVTLADVDMTTLWDVMLVQHTTTDDVIVTSSVEFTTLESSATVARVAINGTADNEKYVLILVGV